MASSSSSAMEYVELELCPNCKKEIPQINYVMHTAHCARNISLCPVCKEPVPKGELAAHKAKHEAKTTTRATQLGAATASACTNSSSRTTTWKSSPYTGPFPEKLGHGIAGAPPPPALSNGIRNQPPPTTRPTPAKKQPINDMDACKYCDLELPRDTLKEHEDYCGTRTDKCNECGEFVMYKYKKLHEESNHGFIKLSDEPGPKPSWDSTTERSSRNSVPTVRTNRQPSAFDMSNLGGAFNMADYIPPSLTASAGSSTRRYYDAEDSYRPSGGIARDPAKIDYKDMSRRLDCKTEYIKNLLHDSASITAPLRSSGTAPRNHFNHHKGQAPLPPRRRNPPTELTIPCEFCQTPIPHEDLIQHETGCRPDLARFNPLRRRRQYDSDDDYEPLGEMRRTPTPPPPCSPEVELPCEFCSDLIPASQLLRHQATCN